MVDLSVRKGKLSLKNPIMTASGTFGYADEFEDFIDVSRLGAVVTKAISLNPRPGNPWNRVIEVTSGMINSIGLENVGIEKFISDKLPVLRKKNIDFVVNLAGSGMDEYVELARICDANKIHAVELNVSCPNVKSGCLEFGTDAKTLGELVKSVREVYNGSLIVKLTPNVTRIEDIALAAQENGADAVSAINTLKGLGMKLSFKNGKFYREQVIGGFSGVAVKPVALGVVNRLKQVLEIPIIGLGGIASMQDVLEFFAVGAEAVQIGTANFTTPDISERIIDELSVFMEENGFKTLEELKAELRCFPPR